MQTEVIVDWTDEKPPSATEVVEWIPSYNSAIPTLDELEDWEQIGKVDVGFGFVIQKERLE